MWRRTQKTFSSLLPPLFLAAGLVLAASYLNRWDAMVPLTLVPIWAWAGLAMALSLVAWIFVRGKALLAVFSISLALGLVFSEESRGLLREFSRTLEPATVPEGRTMLRVASLDLEGEEAGLRRVLDWSPGILLLQGVPEGLALEEFAASLHGEESALVSEGGLAILARGELLNSLSEEGRSVLHARLRLPEGFLVDATTLVLEPCLPQVSLWNPATWLELTEVRAANRRRLRSYQGENQISLGTMGRVIGGAFMTPPGDDVFRPLESNGMVDAHRAAGLGWGNTHPRDYPALRLDQIWVSENLKPFETRTRPLPEASRRFVVADLLLPAAD